MNLKQAAIDIGHYLDMDEPVFLWGPPGGGKSDTVRAVAAARGLPLIDFRAILRDPVDLRGLPTIIDGKAHWLPPSDLPNVERDGPEGILYLDELNAAPASVQAACFGLVLDRKVGEYILPPGWRIIGSGNRQSDKAAAQRMPSALANRFAHIDVEPDVDAFTEWSVKNDIHPLVISFVRFRPSLLHAMEGSDLRAFPTPRSWAKVSKCAHLELHAMQRLAGGYVGQGAAAEFSAFVGLANELPSLDYILEHPADAKLPKNVSAKYAVASGLGRKITAKTIDAAVTYIKRMDREYEVMMVMDAVNRDMSLCETKAFVTWAGEHQDVIFR
jgi:AAA domain (dynein-related subfamily)